MSGNNIIDDDIRRETKDLGLFAESTFAFTEATRLTAGVRYDETKVQIDVDHYQNDNAQCHGGLPPGFGCTTPGPTTKDLTLLGSPELIVYSPFHGDAGKNNFYNVTYKVRLEQDLTPSHLVYGMISTGFLPGDTQVSGGGALPYDEESLTALEVGSKNRFLDDSLQINASVFYYRYGGYQALLYTNPTDPTTGFVATIPARMKGGELEVQYRLTADDHITFTYAATDAYYVDMPAVVSATTITQNHLANVVPQTITLAYDHTFHIPGGSTLNARADVRQLSSRYINNLDPQEIGNGEYNYVHVGKDKIANLGATWTSSSGTYMVTGYMRNVFDNRYTTTTNFSTTFGVSTATGTQYDPRTYGVVLSAHF